MEFFMLILYINEEVTDLPTLPGNCPFCGGPVEVSTFVCNDCGAVAEGRFAPNKLAALDAAQAEFVLAFVRNRGNIKELERELGVSYPTVRARLDDVIRGLGFKVAEDAAAAEEARVRRADVLAAVEKGEMTAAEAADALKQL
jgi:hypothetical protein